MTKIYTSNPHKCPYSNHAARLYFKTGWFIEGLASEQLHPGKMD